MGSENNNNNEPDNGVVPFETALNRAGFGVYSYSLTGLTGLSIISFACIIYSSSILVPINACELETTTFQQSILISMPIVGTIIGAIIWGYLADTRGRRSMLVVSFLSGAIVNAVASLSVNWIMLLILQFLASVLASGQYSLAMTLLSECVPMLKRNLVVLVVASIFLLTQGIMSLIALPIVSADFSHYMPALGIYWNPWRTILLIYCVPSLICFVWILFMQESPKFVFAKGDQDGALRILAIIHRANNKKSKEELQVKGLIPEIAKEPEPGTSSKPIMELFRKPLLKYFIIMTTLSVILKVTVFAVWVPTIVNDFMEALADGDIDGLTLCNVLDRATSLELQASPEPPTCTMNQTGLLIIFGISVMQSLLNLALSFVVDRAGRRNTLICVATVCGVSGILVNVVPNAIASAVLFVIFLMSMVQTGLNTAISVALFPTHLRALAVSLTMTGGRVALIVNVVILRLLIEDYCNVGFFVYCSIFTLSAVIASFLPDDRRRRTQPEPVKPAAKEIEDENETDSRTQF